MAKIDKTVGWLVAKAQSSETPDAAAFPKTDAALSLVDAFPEANRCSAECLIIEHRDAIPRPSLGREAIADALSTQLQLVYGIGAQYESALQSEGYHTLDDLLAHPRWGGASEALLAAWGTPPNPEAVFRSLDRWLPSGHPLCLRALGLVPLERLLFLDLETLGLGGAPVFLAAIGGYRVDGFETRQLLATSLAGEVELLVAMADALRDTDGLVSYNGKSFDITVLRERFAYYGLPFPESAIHVDLLHHARRAYGGTLPDCHLGTIEEHVLGIGRHDDLPSAEVPIAYTAYLESGDANHLVSILRHSRQDLVSLGALLEQLVRESGHA